MCLQMELELPSPLLRLLLTDHEAVTQRGELLELPCDPVVDEVLRQYAKHDNPSRAVLEHTHSCTQRGCGFS